MHLTNRKNRFVHGKKNDEAQAMVEFALVLIALLTVIFILIEAGRAIFLYAAVTNASREAVRYGSAFGINDAGNLKYCDCEAIRNEAIRVGFLLDLQPSDITIEYFKDYYDPDNPAATRIGYCLAASGEDSSIKSVIESGDLVRVSIDYTYNPIVPLLPQLNNTFTSSSARTILGQIQLYDTH